MKLVGSKEERPEITKVSFSRFTTQSRMIVKKRIPPTPFPMTVALTSVFPLPTIIDTMPRSSLRNVDLV